MRLNRALIIGFLIGCALAFVSARPQNQNGLTLQDRMTRAEIYIETLGDRVNTLEHGGSALATTSARDLAVLQQQVLETNQRLDRLERFIAWQVASTLGILVGLIALVIRYWLDRSNVLSRREGRSQQ